MRSSLALDCGLRAHSARLCRIRPAPIKTTNLGSPRRLSFDPSSPLSPILRWHSQQLWQAELEDQVRRYTTIIYRAGSTPFLKTSTALMTTTPPMNNNRLHPSIGLQMSPIAQYVFAVIQRFRPSLIANVLPSPLRIDGSGSLGDLYIRVPVPGKERECLEIFTEFTPHACKHELVVRIWGFEQRESLAPLEDDHFNDYVVRNVLATVDEIIHSKKKVVCVQDGDANTNRSVRSVLIDSRESLNQPDLAFQLLRHSSTDIASMRSPVLVARSWTGKCDQVVLVAPVA